jgi:hypothetical protein
MRAAGAVGRPRRRRFGLVTAVVWIAGLGGAIAAAAVVSEVEDNDTIGTAQPVTVSPPATTRIEAQIQPANDPDYFSFPVTQQAIAIIETTAPEAAACNIDTSLQLYSASHVLIASDTDSGENNCSLLATPVGSFNGTGNYKVAVLPASTTATFAYDVEIQLVTTQCFDGIDNDGDGRTDFSPPTGDTGCSDRIDDTEFFDPDADGFDDFLDNCPGVGNASQANLDADSQGDACDPDDDADGIADTTDNCDLIVNLDQADTDADMQGDLCDPDDDNDTVADGADNCPLVSNAEQTNADGDAAGNSCDSDDDADGLPDGSDNCPIAANPAQRNGDGDGLGNACDLDDDEDGVLDDADNCPVAANGGQADTDGDGDGDSCDSDDDGDGIADGRDGCAGSAAAGPDPDADGCANGEDGDDDGDGLGDANDSCPLASAEADSGCPFVGRRLTLVYKPAKERFKGAVTSRRPECFASQRVLLIVDMPGPDDRIEAVETSPTGAFKFSGKFEPGFYYAAVRAETVEGVGDCGEAESELERIRSGN